MLPFIICWKSVGDEMLPKRIFSIIFFVNSGNLTSHFVNAIVSSLCSRKRNNTRHIDRRRELKRETCDLLLVISRVIQLWTWQHLSKNKTIFSSFLSAPATTILFFCRLFAFIHSIFFLQFYLKLFNFRQFSLAFAVFISYKMEKTHFVVLFVSALAWMPSIAADRFIETKYHCPKR